MTEVSSLTHKIEGFIQDLIQKEGVSDTGDWTEINLIVEKLYELQGELSRYIKAAQEVFNLEFQDDLKFKEKIHELLKILENTLAQSYFGRYEIDQLSLNEMQFVKNIF